MSTFFGEQINAKQGLLFKMKIVNDYYWKKSSLQKKSVKIFNIYVIATQQSSYEMKNLISKEKAKKWKIEK